MECPRADRADAAPLPPARSMQHALRARWEEGRGNAYMGYLPSWLVVRAAYRSFVERPPIIGGLALLAGTPGRACVGCRRSTTRRRARAAREQRARLAGLFRGKGRPRSQSPTGTARRTGPTRKRDRPPQPPASRASTTARLTWKHSLELERAAADQGTRVLAATPHLRGRTSSTCAPTSSPGGATTSGGDRRCRDRARGRAGRRGRRHVGGQRQATKSCALAATAPGDRSAGGDAVRPDERHASSSPSPCPTAATGSCSPIPRTTRPSSARPNACTSWSTAACSCRYRALADPAGPQGPRAGSPSRSCATAMVHVLASDAHSGHHLRPPASAPAPPRLPSWSARRRALAGQDAPAGSSPASRC